MGEGVVHVIGGGGGGGVILCGIWLWSGTTRRNGGTNTEMPKQTDPALILFVKEQYYISLTKCKIITSII